MNKRRNRERIHIKAKKENYIYIISIAIMVLFLFLLISYPHLGQLSALSLILFLHSGQFIKAILTPPLTNYR